MTTKLSTSNIQTQTLNVLGGPKITAIEVTDSSYNVLDDTAVSLTGGYIKITGTGFTTGCRVLINNTPASSVTFVDSTTVRAQVGAKDAGTYVVYLVNTNGGVAISVDGLTYSATPTWSSGSTLETQQTDIPISIQLSATSAQTYTLDAGSTLPTGLSLSSGGLLSGTISIAQATTYSFTINAIDDENQDSPRTFSLQVNVTITDPYFSSTSLLIRGTGSNNGTNSTFLDSSNNSFTITRNGDILQGSFSPFSPTEWSNSFDGSGDYLSFPNSSAFAFGTGSFTIEFWINGSLNNNKFILGGRAAVGTMHITTGGYESTAGVLRYVGSSTIVSNNVITDTAWHHCAIVRNGSSNITLYVDGVSRGTGTDTTNYTTTSGTWYLGTNDSGVGSDVLSGYISNLRIVKGTAVYTSSFTPSTTPLTAVTNTAILTCQSNRFIDKSTNNLTITRSGDTTIAPFSPFNPTIAYSANGVGGSGYFDGSGDYLTVPTNAAFDFGTGDFTVEAWVYLNSGASEFALLSGSAIGSSDLVYYSNSLRFGRNNTAWDHTFNHTLTVSQWNHVAFVKTSGTAKAFVNGVQIGSESSSINYGSVGGNIIIGASRDFSRGLAGYFSNYRIVKGTAVYTTNFTPPTSPLTAIANTSLLVNFTNHNITDATGRNLIIPGGDVKTSTVQSKFSGTGGGSSIYLDGSDLLTVRTNNWPFYPSSVGDFVKSGNVATIEMWIWLSALNSPRSSLISHWNSSGEQGWTIDVDTSGNLFFTSNSSGSGVSGVGITATAWHHLAVVNTGAELKIYLNGVYKNSFNNYTPSLASASPAWPVHIGARSNGSLPVTGYMSNIRWTRGIARYTANFTPPTEPFPVQ